MAARQALPPVEQVPCPSAIPWQVPAPGQQSPSEAHAPPASTHALSGEFAGMDDFEVVAFLVILPERRA